MLVRYIVDTSSAAPTMTRSTRTSCCSVVRFAMGSPQQQHEHNDEQDDEGTDDGQQDHSCWGALSSLYRSGGCTDGDRVREIARFSLLTIMEHHAQIVVSYGGIFGLPEHCLGVLLPGDGLEELIPHRSNL